MTGLITVEDYNSAWMVFPSVFTYTIDLNGFREYSDVASFDYDFMHIKTDDVSLGKRFKLTMPNSLVTGAYYTRGSAVKTTSWYSDDEFRITLDLTQEDLGTLTFELATSQPYNNGQRYLEGSIDNICFYKEHLKEITFEDKSTLSHTHKLYVTTIDGETVEITDHTVTPRSGGVRYVTFDLSDYDDLNPFVQLYAYSSQGGYTFSRLSIIRTFKNPNFLNITGNLLVGKADNKLTIEPFIYDEDNPIPCTITYLDKTLTFNLTETQDVTIDLTEKTDTKDLKLKAVIGEGPNSNAETLEYKLPVTYQQITTYDDLANELEITNGNTILYLNNTITGNADLNINHDAIIYGNNHNIELDGHSITIKEGITVRFQDIGFVEGDNAIIQKAESNLTLNNCTFEDCTSTDNEGLGSCIYCDIDLSSLIIPNDFTTTIQGCSFDNSHGAILHGGTLTVTDSTFTIDDAELMNTHSPYFLYQTDGYADISRTSFEVELGDDSYFCTNQKNANLAQCLFVAGADAIINDLSTKELEDKVNFFNGYNNTSTIRMKYYYPDIEACVIIEPDIEGVGKNLCYGLSNVDYIFRENTNIRRA